MKIRRNFLAKSIVLLISLSVVCYIPAINAISEPPSTEWNKDYTSLHGAGFSVIQTEDGGYAIAGVNNGEFLHLKTNSIGDVQWSQTYGKGYARSIIQTNDGGYALAGNGTLHNFVKTDSEGNIQLNKTFSKPGSTFLVNSLIQTRDGGYALAGWTSPDSASEGGRERDWLVKTDSEGNIQWDKTYGGSVIGKIIEESDGSYVMIDVQDNNGLLIKTDSTGKVQWEKTYGIANSLIKTEDGGYLLVGNAWLQKIDSDGEPQWIKNYDIGGGGNYLFSVASTSDGGYAASGSTLLMNKVSAWVIKTNSTGSMEWNVTYAPSTGDSNIAGSTIETKNKGIAFTGSKDVTSSGYGDVWLVKIGPTATANSSTEIFPLEIFVISIVTVIILIAILAIFFFRRKAKGLKKPKSVSIFEPKYGWFMDPERF